jgi:N utilization substance protein B
MTAKNTASHSPKRPFSLARKSSARVAAVQCIYRLKITGENTEPEALLEDYLAGWKDDKSGSTRVISLEADPDKSFLRKLITGVMQNRESIDAIIRSSLNDKWTPERMSPLLLALLACSVYEMKYSPALAAPVIIDEYVTLTGRFFEAPEVGFVNGLLETLAKELRSPS